MVGPPRQGERDRRCRRSDRAKADAGAETSSLKVTVTFVPDRGGACPTAGVTAVTVGRGVRRGGERRVCSEAVERVGGEPVPLDDGSKASDAVGVAGADRRLAAQGVVGGAGQARCPTRCRGRRRSGRSTSTTAPCPCAARRRRRRCTSRLPFVWSACARMVASAEAWASDEHVARGDRAREVDRQAGRRGPVEVHLDVVAAGGEVDGGTGAVVDLECLVVARPLDVLREEELASAAADAATGVITTGTATARAPTATLPTNRRNDEAMGPPGSSGGPSRLSRHLARTRCGANLTPSGGSATRRSRPVGERLVNASGPPSPRAQRPASIEDSVLAADLELSEEE